MRTLILAVLLCLSLTAYGQPSEHCIPIDESRWLHEQALKVLAADSLIHYQGKQIEVLKWSNSTALESYKKLLDIERERVQYHKEIAHHMESWGNSWRDQATYYQKAANKQRRQKKGLIAGMAILIGVMIVK